jgi:hypothetical protein
VEAKTPIVVAAPAGTLRSQEPPMGPGAEELAARLIRHHDGAAVAAVDVVAPGKRNGPCRDHLAQAAMFIALEGTGHLRVAANLDLDKTWTTGTASGSP